MLLGEYRLFGGGGDINRPSGGGRISPAPWGGGMNGGINGGGGPGINGGINGGGGSTPISGGAFGDSTRIGEGAVRPRSVCVMDAFGKFAIPSKM